MPAGISRGGPPLLNRNVTGKRSGCEVLTRISHRPSAAAAASLAVAGRAPSGHMARGSHMCDPCIDMMSTMPSASLRPCAPPQRRCNAIATNVGEICGLICFNLQATVPEAFILAQCLSKSPWVIRDTSRKYNPCAQTQYSWRCPGWGDCLKNHNAYHRAWGFFREAGASS